MKRITDLVNSLTTILVRYHEGQGINLLIKKIDSNTGVRKASRAEAIKFLQKENLESELTQLNVESVSKYSERLDLLTFIKDEIIVLKKQSEKRTPYTEKEFEEYKKKMEQLLIDFNNLLNTHKSKTSLMQVIRLDGTSQTNIALEGLNNSTRISSALCYSGTLIKEEIIERYNISTESDEEIREVAASICQEHQNELLTLALREVLHETKKAHAVAIETQIQSLNQKKLDLETALSEKQELERQLQETKHSLQENQEVNSQQAKEITVLKTALEKARTSTGDLFYTLLAKASQRGGIPHSPTLFPMHHHQQSTTRTRSATAEDIETRHSSYGCGISSQESTT